MNSTSVIVITGGGLPVPNVEGGAVESLVTMLASENERQGLLDLTILSSSTHAAVETISKDIQSMCHTQYKLFEVPVLIKAADLLMYWVAKNILHKHDLMAFRYFAQRLWFGHKVSQYLKHHSADRLVFENTLLPMRALRCSANKSYIDKTFVHMHNQLTHCFGMNKYLTKIRGFLTVSNYISENLIESIEGLDMRHCHVVRNGVDIAKFNSSASMSQRKEFREKYGISEEDIVFLFAGRLTPEKGAEQLLQAFRQVVEVVPKARLVIAGAYFFKSDIVSPFEQRLNELSGDLVTNGRIVFTGFLNYDDMPAAYAMADVCVMPSIWDEPAGLTIIESLASGKPLITTRSGGIPEYADNQAAVILERDQDLIPHLAQAMIDLACDPAKRAVMSMRGTELSEQLTPSAYLHSFSEAIQN